MGQILWLSVKIIYRMEIIFMRKRLIMAVISLAILIGIIISIFSFNGEEKVYREGVLVDTAEPGENTGCKEGTFL